MMYSWGMMDGWTMLGGWGLSHWLMFTLMVLLIVFPVGLILRKLGFSPLWSALVLVPGINLVGLWAVALTETQLPSAARESSK